MAHLNAPGSRPRSLTGFAIGRIRKLLNAGYTHEQVAARMRVSARDVEAAEGG